MCFPIVNYVTIVFFVFSDSFNLLFIPNKLHPLLFDIFKGILKSPYIKLEIFQKQIP